MDEADFGTWRTNQKEDIKKLDCHVNVHLTGSNIEKVVSSLDNVGVETNINDFSTFSMDIFFDTTSSLENATKLLLDANKNSRVCIKSMTHTTIKPMNGLIDEWMELNEKK